MRNTLTRLNRMAAGMALIAIIVLNPQSASVAQETSTSKLDSIVGAVVSVDQLSRSASVKTDAGAVSLILTDENTACLRIPAGERSLAKAVAIQFSDIAVGDRVLGHGLRTAQGFKAQRLIVLSSTEVEKKRRHDLEDWKQRGVGGIVRELDRAANEVTIEVRSSAPRPLIIKAGTAHRRYVSYSLRLEAARSATFADIKTGDQLRALGDTATDGRHFSAEAIVFGTFKTIGVTVTEVDQSKGEIRPTTLDQKKPVSITVNGDSLLHRISPPVAAAIAQKVKGDTARPANATPASAKSGAAPVIDVQQMIDTLPAVSLSEIKPGDVLAVTGAVEQDESRLIAIKIAAGGDLVLKALTPAPGNPQLIRLSAGLPAVFDFSVLPIN